MQANEVFPAPRTIGTSAISLPFDQPTTVSMNRARLAALDWILDGVQCPIATACDLGTGVGNFAGHLATRRLAVSAVDVRPSNIEEARTRYPGVRFVVGDVDDPSLAALGQFDLVTAFGLFYHLENPFRAARNLALLCRQLAIVESMICPGASTKAFVVDEFAGEDQGVNLVAFQLTEGSLIKLLYRAGMPYVYSPRTEVDHPDFRSGLLRRRMRTILVASRRELPGKHFIRHSEPEYALDRAYYYRSLPALLLRPLLRFRRKRRTSSGGT
jgi:hypothetical protein